jgi:predicted aspartyl protease
MDPTRVTVRVRNIAAANGGYESDFLVDTGATDSLAPSAELRKAGIEPIGKTAYELANGALKNMNSDSLKLPSWVKSPPDE